MGCGFRTEWDCVIGRGLVLLVCPLGLLVSRGMGSIDYDRTGPCGRISRGTCSIVHSLSDQGGEIK